MRIFWREISNGNSEVRKFPLAQPTRALLFVHSSPFSSCSTTLTPERRQIRADQLVFLWVRVLLIYKKKGFIQFLNNRRVGSTGVRAHPSFPTTTEPGAHNFACGANYHIPVWFNFACGANYHIPGWFNYACGANYHIPGWFNYACGANYPYQALKGGLFCICVESTNLT